MFGVTNKRARSRRRKFCSGTIAAIESCEDRTLLSVSNGDSLRTYRLAMSATEEFTASLGNDVDAVQQFFESRVSDLNAILRRELNVRLELLDISDLIFGPQNSPDPFSSQSLLTDFTHLLFREYVGRYDIAHVLRTGSEGGSATVPTNGGLGVGQSNGFSSFVHEIGHQLGGMHVMNGVSDFCASFRNASTAWEPGGGSTILGYDTGCGGDSLPLEPHHFFHAGSIEQIVANLEQLDAKGVGTVSSNVNSIPVVDGGDSYVIPARTPFELTVTATDTDGDDLQFTIDQMDLGPAQSVTSIDNGQSPLFRSLAPQPGQSAGQFIRTFPQIADIISGTTTIGETLPSTNRQLNFRVGARDQVGGFGSDDTTLTVIDTGAAFGFTSFDAAATITGGSTQTVTWDVAGTDANGINVDQVELRLSEDGGFTFPHVIGRTANDGTHQFTMPNIDTDSARLQLRAIDNVFMNVSAADFAINSDTSAPGVSVGLSDGRTLVSEREYLASTTDTYTLALHTVPEIPVEITVSAGAGLEVSLNGQSFHQTVTSTHSDTASRTIHIRSIDDDVAEGTVTSRITHRVSNATTNYPASAIINDVNVTIVDDERPPLIGVDFQRFDNFVFDGNGGGAVPENWTELNEQFDSATGIAELTQLIREDGTTTSVGLTIGPRTPANASGTNHGFDIDDVPNREPSLHGVGGQVGWNRSDRVIDARWSGLNPGQTYNLYVFSFGHSLIRSSSSRQVNNSFTIQVEGDGITDPPAIAQSVATDRVLINGTPARYDADLESFAVTATANPSGQIDLTFTRDHDVLFNSVNIAAMAIQELPPVNTALSITLTGRGKHTDFIDVEFSAPADANAFRLRNADGTMLHSRGVAISTGRRFSLAGYPTGTYQLVTELAANEYSLTSNVTGSTGDPVVAAIDLDGSGAFRFANDGVLLLAYTLGIRGANLEPFGGGSRSGEQIETVIGQLADSLDLDGDGELRFANDGVLLLAHSLGINGTPLAAFRSAEATRDVGTIEDRLEGLLASAPVGSRQQTRDFSTSGFVWTPPDESTLSPREVRNQPLATAVPLTDHIEVSVEPCMSVAVEVTDVGQIEFSCDQVAITRRTRESIDVGVQALACSAPAG